MICVPSGLESDLIKFAIFISGEREVMRNIMEIESSAGA